ncbi:hypothetical protein LWS69_00735 [Bordetella hinzii]|uniref:hypothetical protein n=1 Tax=Burkholderia multivorans TaxID=87883 RepID=UPI001C237802|nr:hypothetical protein [Burkholderia multivorans]MBU9366218.1 hypothetical protein [Burkholderia multivorans]MCJ9707558.1 hypothetical protein [Bordetella hinzii]
MDIPNSRYRCPLAKLQPKVTDLEAVKRRGWRDQHILVVSPDDDRLDWTERELVRQIGERLYGAEDPRHG